MEMCYANNFHRLFMQWIHHRALNYKMQHFVAQIREMMHSPAIWFICQYASVSLFLRQQERMTALGRKPADFLFKRQNLTSSVKWYWFNYKMLYKWHLKNQTVWLNPCLFSTGRISISADAQQPWSPGPTAGAVLLAILLSHRGRCLPQCHSKWPRAAAIAWHSCGIPICQSTPQDTASPLLCQQPSMKASHRNAKTKPGVQRSWISVLSDLLA